MHTDFVYARKQSANEDVFSITLSALRVSNGGKLYDALFLSLDSPHIICIAQPHSMVMRGGKYAKE